MKSYPGGLLNDGLSNSLKAIRAAKSRFHVLSTRSPTKAVLASQIELCDILLEEIRSISSSLEKRISSCKVRNRRSEATRRARSSRHPIAPQRERASRSKRGKAALRPRARKPAAAKRDREDAT